MHELALAMSIVEMVAEHAKGRRVRSITLEVGKHSCVMPDAIRFCFEAAASGGALEGSRLEIIEVEGRARCRACGAVFVRENLWAACGCGAEDCEPISGDELRVKEYQVDVEAVV
jgi:hydrogenase nickel incorporation protein HypA/HybF